MLLYNKTAQKILFDPLDKGGDHIYILSGYAAPTMLSWYLKNLKGRTSKPICIDLIVGMTAYDGISTSVHEGFKQIVKSQMPPEVEKVSCSYVCDLPAVHSNIFVWTSNDSPICAFTGSAEFLQSSFVGNNREELMVSYKPADAMSYFFSVLDRSIYIKHAEIEEYIRIKQTHPIFDQENSVNEENRDAVRLSLLSRNGYPGKTSGLNWGHRNKRNRNEAYIPLPKKISATGFFPLDCRHFSVMTDDRKNLILRVEQQGNKAITTPNRNSDLGEYFRNRLGLPNGAFVTRDDLERYGRTDVMFEKIDEETFYMDFSPPDRQ